MGGIIAQKMAGLFEDQIKSLTLVNTTAKVDLENPDSIETVYKLQKLLHQDLEENIPPGMAGEKEKILEFIKANDDIGVSSHYLGEFMGIDYRHMIKKIRVPVLIIAGEKDKCTPPEWSMAIHRSVKNSEFYNLKDAGHYIPLYNADYFNNKVMEFINKHEGKKEGT